MKICAEPDYNRFETGRVLIKIRVTNPAVLWLLFSASCSNKTQAGPGPSGPCRQHRSASCIGPVHRRSPL